MTFSKLDIHERLLQTLDKLGYKTPTPVQDQVIPKIIEGNDLRVSAPTGTGKTAAFLLPSITKLLNNPPSTKVIGPRILVLVPTRELCLQVAEQAEKYSRRIERMKTVCIYGGVPYHKQSKALKQQHEIIIATPGRFIDYLDRGHINLDRVETFVLDEADRMLDMGFSEPVQKIADALPSDRQTLLFSATLKGNVLKLSKKLLAAPLEINVNKEFDKEENIDQHLHYVDNIQHKNKILDHLLKNTDIEQAIIFTSTKSQADTLTKTLKEMKYSAAKLHGDINQRQRTKTLTQLRKGQIQFLVATDVAARGIDVKTISHVFNFDLPSCTEDYIHRIGRTARAGATGTSYSLATPRERHLVLSIEKLTGKKMIKDVIPGLEPTKKVETRRSKPANFRGRSNSRKVFSNSKKTGSSTPRRKQRPRK